MAKKQYLECGRVQTAHGVHGTLRVESLCDSPEILCALKTVYLPVRGGEFSPRRVHSAAPHKGGALMTLEGVDNREDAMLLHGKMLFAARADIPIPDEAALIADMIDLPVLDADTGKRYGVLVDVQPSPAADLYDVLTDSGKHVLLPAVPAFLDRIDVESGVYIRPIPGFFDEEGN
jgi:16S rRNA processing protein RimM